MVNEMIHVALRFNTKGKGNPTENTRFNLSRTKNVIILDRFISGVLFTNVLLVRRTSSEHPRVDFVQPLHFIMGQAISVLRGYKWQDFTEPEQEAVSDAVQIGATRAAVGLGTVLTAAAAFSGGMYNSSFTNVNRQHSLICREPSNPSLLSTILGFSSSRKTSVTCVLKIR